MTPAKTPEKATPVAKRQGKDRKPITRCRLFR